MRCFPQLAFLIFCSLQFLAGLSIMAIFANSVMLSKSTLLALCTFQALTLTLTSRLCLNFESCLCFRGFFFFFFSCRMDSAPIPSPGNDSGNLYQWFRTFKLTRSGFCHSRLVYFPAGGFCDIICHLSVFKE